MAVMLEEHRRAIHRRLVVEGSRMMEEHRGNLMMGMVNRGVLRDVCCRLSFQRGIVERRRGLFDPGLFRLKAQGDSRAHL